MELGDIISLYSSLTIVDGSTVLDWRSVLTKYTKLPGIRSLHDFVFMKNSVSNEVISTVRDNYFEGAFQNARIHIIHGRDVKEDVIHDPGSQNYAVLGKVREVTEKKYKHLQQMCKDFLPSDRHLPMIN